MDTMRILVTGHKGYIGAVMTGMLVAEGYEPTGIDSDLYERCSFGSRRLFSIPEKRKDIRDMEREDLVGFDAVLHLAGLSNDPLGDLNPELTYDINYRASVRLAELAKEAGVRRFVFSSSCSNYGAGGQDWLTEQSAFNPVTPYGRSKVQVEQELSHMADARFSPTYLRNATAFGFSTRLRFDLVLNNLTAWATTTGRVHLKGDGTAWRPIVHIQDISRAFIAVLKAPREAIHNQAFNVGRNEDNYRIRDIAEIVRESVPGSRVEYAEGASADTRCYRVDCSKIKRTLPEFRPIWNARLGAEELYRAFDEYGLALEEFEGEKYKRLAHIKMLIRTGELDESLRWRALETAGAHGKQLQETSAS